MKSNIGFGVIRDLLDAHLIFKFIFTLFYVFLSFLVYLSQPHRKINLPGSRALSHRSKVWVRFDHRTSRSEIFDRCALYSGLFGHISLFFCNLILTLKSVFWYCRYQLHFHKVTKFVIEFKWKRKFNLLKALLALRNTFSSWHSRSFFCIHFCKILIINMNKKMYLIPNISKRKKIRRLFISKRFFILTFILYFTYFRYKMEFLILNI